MFDHLLARAVYRQDATPNTLYIVGYDNNIDSQVCWIVTVILHHQIKLRWNALQTTHACDDHRSMYRPTWLYGVAYVGGENMDVDLFDLDPQRITPDEYQRIVAEAQS